MNNDVQFLVECLSTELVSMLMEKYGWDIKKALDEYYSSETYKKLTNPECGLYYEGAVYVFQFLEQELEMGEMGLNFRN
jgi:hypothetical protein